MFIRNFQVNQTASLSAFSIDPQIPGVCWAMTYDWIKRELSGVAHHQATYIGHNITKFNSLQRAYAESANPNNFIQQNYTRDGLNGVTTVGPFAFNLANLNYFTNYINGSHVGYLQLIGPAGFHGTAFSKRAGVSSYFDPLYGQYSCGVNDDFGLEIAGFLQGPATNYNVLGFRISRFPQIAPRDHQWLANNNP